LWAGILLGISASFRHDLGLYGLAALCAGDVIFRAMAAGTARERRRSAAIDLARLCGGALIPVLPVMIALLCYVPLHDLAYALFYYPARVYPAARALPFPDWHQVLQGFRHPWTIRSNAGVGDAEFNIVWAPVLVVVTAALWLLPAIRHRALSPWKAGTFSVLVLLTSLFFVKGLVRVSPEQMVQAVLLAFVLWMAILAEWANLTIVARIAAAVTTVWIAGCLLAASHAYYRNVHQNITRLHRSDGDQSFASLCHPPTGMSRAKCFSLPADELKAMAFVQQHTKPDDRIFVGNDRHDKLLDDDITFYFVSQRDAATRWYQFDPGVETTEPIQRQMIADLDRNHAVVVVREQGFSDSHEPNASSLSTGVTLLDRYIDANYQRSAAFDRISVLRRSTPFSRP
jgi:hypothetical protein